MSEEPREPSPPESGGEQQESVNTAPADAYGPSPMTCNATRLMIAVKRGDRDAFDELVRTVRGQAFHVARSLVGSREDAMELSQEAFLKTYRARDTYREGEPFLPWFHRILRNTCFSFLRKNGKLKKRSLSAGPEDDPNEASDWEIVDEGPSPMDVVEAGERQKAFWRGFAGLSARDREMIALRHFRELSYQEIADTLEIPIGTVMSRLYHARRRLRESLAGILDEELPIAT